MLVGNEYTFVPSPASWGSSEESLRDHLSVLHCCLLHWRKKSNLKMLHVVTSKFMLFKSTKLNVRGRSDKNIEVFTVLYRAFEIE